MVAAKMANLSKGGAGGYKSDPSIDGSPVTQAKAQEMLNVAPLDVRRNSGHRPGVEIYEIRPLPSGKVELSGPLGIVERIEIDTAREAALHAQFCAQGGEAALRIFDEAGKVTSERPIPPAKPGERSFGMGIDLRTSWF